MERDHLISKERHKNKVVLITGSSMGIGYAILKRLAQEGATVILSSRKKENCEVAQKELDQLKLKYITIIANFSKKEERTMLFNEIKEKFGRLDGLVCNIAASTHFGELLEINESQFSKMYESNVQNTFFTIKEAFPLLQKGVNASILIISSLSGYMPFAKIGIYSNTKTALLGLIKLLAIEFSKYNIRVNGIAPGVIKTKMAGKIVDSKEAKLNIMQRVGVPDEISGVAAFLMSEDASFITAETIIVSGGSLARL